MVCYSADLVLDEAGDAYQAVVKHGIDRARAEELSAVVTGRVDGRVRDDEITLFKSVGTGAQDLIVASHLLDLAAAAGVGTVVADVNSIKSVAREG